jgi:hypothetical protein
MGISKQELVAMLEEDELKDAILGKAVKNTKLKKRSEKFSQFIVVHCAQCAGLKC